MSALCSRCAATVPPGAKFCGECGAPLLARCAACGTVAAQTDQRFCLECGAALGAPAPAGATGSGRAGFPAASTVERRQVSVLFADLTGFTAFSERRDAEEVREMLSEYFDLSRRIVESYGGHVEKFIGDAVMALWGAPVANEDDAERAVRAALDLVGAVTDLGERLGVTLRLRVGVLTGQAAVELDAITEGMVIGDAINTASRIQSLAPPGTVLVDDVTRAVTARAIAYEDAGAQPVKGKADPVHTWRALRVIAVVGGAERTDLELPLVGREEEMATIRRAVDALVGPPAGLALITVVGEPGLGKSRLVWELKKYGDGLAATMLWNHGQAASFGQGVGFSALAEMVRTRARVGADEPERAQDRGLEALVDAAFAGDDPALGERVLRGLRRLLGLDDGDERIDRGELFSAWRLLFERLSARTPVVMVFEDLHWADQGLFDFIVHLTEWASRSRILVFVFSRPDDRLAPVTALGERIELGPLSGGDIEALVAAAVEDAPATLLHSVGEHAAGVPLFAVESLRMLADRGMMVAAGDAQRYRLVAEVGELEVPPSIHSLVAARLDRLGELERRLLRSGAVLGQRFGAAAAAALAGVSAGDAKSLLAGLAGKQFLSIDTDPRSPARGTYAFVHRQVQRVVLDTLSKRERKARHLAAVEYLAEQGPAADLAAILAGHLVAALEAQPSAADAAEIRRRALRLTLDAAQRADAVGALNEAVALFAQAARIELEESRQADHLVRAAGCAERYGNQEQVAAGYYAAARRLHEQAGRDREALRLRARELCVYRWSLPPAELIPALREVYDALRGRQDAAFADAAGWLAGILYSDGAAEPAELIAAEAAQAAIQAGADEELGFALNCRASALIELGRPVEALPLFEAALETRRRWAPSEVPASLGNLAVTYTALGRFDQALAAGQEAMAAGERLANRVHRNTAALYVARALFALGDWDEAVATIEEVAPHTAPANRGMAIGPPLLVALERGDHASAQRIIDQFDADQAESGAAFESDYRSLREVALAHLAGNAAQAGAVIDRGQSGDYAEWPTWLPLAIDLIARPGDEARLRGAATALRRDVVPSTSPLVSAQIARVDALLAARADQAARAAAGWAEAIEIAAGARVSFDAAVLRLELFEHLPKAAGARDGLDQAIETFERLRALPWLERSRTAAAGRVGSPEVHVLTSYDHRRTSR